MENIQLNLYGTINLIGAIQGIILALVFVFNKNYDTPSKKYIVVLLVACVNINFIGIVDELDFLQVEKGYWYSPFSLYPLISPAVYFSIHFFLNPDRNTKLWEYSLYIPFIIVILHQCYLAIYYFNNSEWVYHLAHNNIQFYIVLSLEILNSIMFLFVFNNVIFFLKKYEKALYNQYSDLSNRSIQWLINSLISGLVLTLIWLVTIYLDFANAPLYDHDERVLGLGVSLLVYWIGYGLIIRPELFSSARIIKELDKEIPPSTLTTEPTKLSGNTDKHHQKLIELMSDKALFRDPDFNLGQLALEMNLSKGYLSQIINQKEQKNFFEFANYYRVEDVKRKLKDEAFTHFSIMGIATDSGFKSKSTFNAVFKKMTGMTPSQFRKQNISLL